MATPKKVINMFKLLLDIVDYYINPNIEWYTETEWITIEEFSNRAHILLKEIKENNQ